MIDRIILKNFKCFEDLDLELSNLNVMAGINSVGKSTAIQSLLLLRQAYELQTIDNGVSLNGDLVSIGTGQDIMYRDSNDDFIGIQIVENSEDYNWNYQYDAKADYLKLKNFVNEKGSQKLNLFHNNFAFIPAERIGPQRTYQKSYHEVVTKKQLGYHGELAADYIAENAGNLVKNSFLILNPEKGKTLGSQISEWLSTVSPGVKLEARSIVDAGMTNLQFSEDIPLIQDKYNPMNVGFGLSYVLPVVLALLKAQKGDLVILENPEAHLHPKGQRKIGEMIAKACAGGVQVIVETHSDHLLNGIRLSVKNETLSRKTVRLNYFTSEIYSGRFVHEKRSPQILDDGSLSDWPEGFFDEWDKALDELF